ncbi:MAG TPA: AMP-binding protein [Cyclobacteriaceae bacterium]|jgi:phenylacetate-CoA ligase|nr:AMP-binding protein [Cyclobacteriaceae bacterium]
MKFQPEIERRLASEVRQFQDGELKKLMRFLEVNSPFYKRHFQTHGINVEAILTLDNLRLVPPTTKDDLQQFNWDFLCVPKNRIIEYTSTSGTLGKPVTIALTEKDLQRLAYNESISFACAGATNDDVFQLMLTLDRQFMAGIAYHEGIRKLGAGLIRVGPGLPSMQWDSIQRLQPTTLVAVPSFLIKLIEFARNNDIDLNQSSVRKAICIGESIRTPEFELNSLGKKIQDSWNIELFGTYASTEMQTAFTECKHGRGGHHHPELLIVEVLDENDFPVDSGKPGEITITTLGVEGMPLLRYKTGDIAQTHEAPCACGRTSLRVGPIIGRKQQMIKLKGTTFYPPAIFEILHQSSVVDYVIEVFENEFGLDDLTIYLPSDNGSLTEPEIKNIFQSKMRIVPQVIFLSRQQIEVLQSSGQGRKLQKLLDRRVRQ